MNTQNSYLPSKPHYEILDGLRGVAAGMVVAFHLLEAHSGGNHLEQFINHGYLAVDFFFMPVSYTHLLFVSFLYSGAVAYAELVVVMSLYQHVAYVLYRPELITDGHADTVISVIVVTAVCGFVLSVHSGEDFGWLHTEVCHAVLQQGNIDAFGAFAVQLHQMCIRDRFVIWRTLIRWVFILGSLSSLLRHKL